ncbi:MAG: right-handed parallel beta-helix repeat-containing protein [Pseudomonadota bacterium]
MPEINFQGFPVGAPVNISAQQEGQIASGSVVAWGSSTPSTIQTLAISSARTIGFAPFPVQCRADMTSTASRFEIPFNDTEGVWTSSHAAEFTALTNAPIWGTDASIAYGPAACFTLPAGSHTVSFTGYDGESSRAADNHINVTVFDPDVVFAGADTAVVSAVSDFADAPSGASQFTTVAAAVVHLDGRQNQRILLHAGETFTDLVQLAETSGSDRNLYIGSYGNANNGRAIIDKTGSLTEDAVVVRGNSWGQVSVTDLELIGPFDATNQGFIPVEPTNTGVSFSEGGSNKPVDAHKLVNNCIIDGFALGVAFDGFGGSGGTPNRDIHINNTTITNWIVYGLFGQTVEDLTVTGCSIKAPSGSVNAKEATGTFMKSSPLRMGEPQGTIIFSNNDMSVYSHNFASNDNRLASPILRILDGGQPGFEINDTEILVDRMRSEGGPFDIYTTRTGAIGVTDNFIVVDRLHHIETSGFGAVLSNPHGGSTLRNSVVIAANVAPGVASGTSSMINVANNTGPATRRQEAYSNFFLDDRSDANARNRSGSDSDRDYNLSGDDLVLDTPPGSFFGNNIEQTRNMTTGAGPDTGPIDETTHWTSGYTGEIWALDGGSGFETPADRQYQGAVPTILPVPQIGHSAIGGASGKVSILDWNGNLRSGFAGANSTGPWEFNTSGGSVNLQSTGTLGWQTTPVQAEDDLRLDFDGPITAGTGTITLRARSNSGFETAETWDISNVTISGNSLILTPTALLPLMDYAIRIDADALDEFDGIADDNTATFRVDRGYVQPSLNPADYTTVYDGQSFTGGSTLAFDVDGLSSVLVRNCTIGDTSDTGGRVGNSTDVVFYQCTIQNTGRFGVQLRDSAGNGSARVYFIDCEFRNCVDDGIQIPQAANIGEDNPDCVIVGCTFEDVASPQSGAGQHHVYTQGTNNMVLDCQLRGVTDANGISVRSDGIVHNNDIQVDSDRYPGAGAGIKYFSDHRTGPRKRLIIADNTISSPAGELDSGIDLDRTTSNQFGADEDWVVNDFYLLRNTYGSGLDDNVVVDGALTNLSFVTITEYA